MLSLGAGGARRVYLALGAISGFKVKSVAIAASFIYSLRRPITK